MKPGRRGTKQAAGRADSSSRAVMALALMGGLVLLYGWNTLFLAPKAKAQAEVKKELVAARKQEDDLRRNLAELRKLASDTQAREAELTRIGRLIPAEPDVAGAIVTLDETARQAQVSMSSFVPTPPAATAGGATSISVTMKVAGTFQQVFDYLRRLESLERLVVVDAIQLGASGGEAASPTLAVDVKARMFSAGSATPAAGATAAAGTRTSPSDSAALTKAGG